MPKIQVDWRFCSAPGVLKLFLEITASYTTPETAITAERAKETIRAVKKILIVLAHSACQSLAAAVTRTL
jgi:hypothetical protein